MSLLNVSTQPTRRLPRLNPKPCRRLIPRHRQKSYSKLILMPNHTGKLLPRIYAFQSFPKKTKKLNKSRRSKDSSCFIFLYDSLISPLSPPPPPPHPRLAWSLYQKGCRLRSNRLFPKS